MSQRSDKTDGFTGAGAQRLVRIIRDYWQSHGYVIDPRIEISYTRIGPVSVVRSAKMAPGGFPVERIATRQTAALDALAAQAQALKMGYE